VRDRVAGRQAEGLKFRASREHLAEFADLLVSVCESGARRPHRRLQPGHQRFSTTFTNLAAQLRQKSRCPVEQHANPAADGVAGVVGARLEEPDGGCPDGQAVLHEGLDHRKDAAERRGRIRHVGARGNLPEAPAGPGDLLDRDRVVRIPSSSEPPAIELERSQESSAKRAHHADPAGVLLVCQPLQAARSYDGLTARWILVVI
jgi:hypothetical protein